MRNSDKYNITIPNDYIDLERTVFQFRGKEIHGKELAKILGIDAKDAETTPFNKFKLLTGKLLAVPKDEISEKDKSDSK